MTNSRVQRGPSSLETGDTARACCACKDAYLREMARIVDEFGLDRGARWVRQRGLITGPSWTEVQLQKALDLTDLEGRRRGTRGSRGLARWNAGYSCAECRKFQQRLHQGARVRQRAARLPVELRRSRLGLFAEVDCDVVVVMRLPRPAKMLRVDGQVAFREVVSLIDAHRISHFRLVQLDEFHGPLGVLLGLHPRRHGQLVL